ncbi:MxcI [Myxococcus sp. Y35]|uniref:MxcI n=1 Tax=Pseudomyxococcus flavus TaxID=3115648 RepID=UPI003CF26384
MRKRSRLATASTTSLMFLAASLTACGSSDSEPNVNPDETESGPMYSLATSILGESPVTYVSVFDSLDVTSLDLEQASEHSGFATIGAAGGKLFVGAGEAPELTRYSVFDSGRFQAAGKISFASYGLATAPLYLNHFADGTSAYMQLEESRRIVWNPEAMTISGPVESPGLATERDGLVVRASYDRAVVARGGYSFQPFYWTDGNYYRFAPSSQIAVYSHENDSLVALLDAPCPGLDVATQDEDGNIYFSNWVFSAGAPVVDATAPDTCAVRIKAGELAIDEEWTRSLASMVGGRQTAAFRYIGDGVGVVAAFHDDSPGLSAEPTAADVTNGTHWKLWQVNLETGEGAPIEGLDWIAGGYYAFSIEGRTFLLLPTQDYASTAVWELNGNGSAVKRFETLGWAYQLVKVR